MMSWAAANKRVCHRETFAELQSVCFMSSSSEVLLSVKTRTVNDVQQNFQDWSTNLIAFISYRLMLNKLSLNESFSIKIPGLWLWNDSNYKL